MTSRGRTIVCGAWLAGQVALVATAGARADHAFGFRMFEESSTVQLHVDRVLDDGGLLPIEEDAWEARDCAGAPHRLVWSQRVRFPAPQWLDRIVAAPYGVDAALAEARAAVAWVAAHTVEDCQTLALRAVVRLRRNGRDLPPVAFEIARPGAR